MNLMSIEEGVGIYSNPKSFVKSQSGSSGSAVEKVA
jgi:hypothetical protein